MGDVVRFPGRKYAARAEYHGESVSIDFVPAPGHVGVVVDGVEYWNTAEAFETFMLRGLAALKAARGKSG